MTVTRSDRKAKPAHRLIEAMSADIEVVTADNVSGEIFCYLAMFPHDDEVDYTDPLVAYKAVSDRDTLCYHEAMRERDRDQFEQSMLKEISDQFENGNFTIVPRSEVLPYVRSNSLCFVFIFPKLECK